MTAPQGPPDPRMEVVFVFSARRFAEDRDRIISVVREKAEQLWPGLPYVVSWTSLDFGSVWECRLSRVVLDETLLLPAMQITNEQWTALERQRMTATEVQARIWGRLDPRQMRPVPYDDIDPPRDHVEAFLDYARRGDKAGFLELATCLGIHKNEREPMWRGTVARLGKEITERSETEQSTSPPTQESDQC